MGGKRAKVRLRRKLLANRKHSIALWRRENSNDALHAWFNMYQLMLIRVSLKRAIGQTEPI